MLTPRCFSLFVFYYRSVQGYTNWAIGMSTAYIAKAVLNDTRTIVPVSTCVRGLYGVEHDVFLSVPCSLCSDGVQRIAVLPLTEEEKATFNKCAQGIW
jgi:L-lactate dehydrogenase